LKNLRALAVVLPLALLQATAPRPLGLVGVFPNLVVLAVVLWTLRRGLEEGLRWALLGGLLMDVLSTGPIGANLLAMLVATALAALTRRLLLGESPPLMVLTLEAALAVFLLVQSAALMLSGWSLGGLHALETRMEAQLLAGLAGIALLWLPLLLLDGWVGRPAVPEF
jgi:rod shape-determining protein MreD